MGVQTPAALGSLAGRHVIVIGGSSGMGLATAALAASEGARVTVCARDEAKLARAAGAIGAAVAVRPLDVTDEAGVQRFFLASEPIDHLVMTAHASSVVTGAIASLSAMALDAARAFMETKFWGMVRVAKYAPAKLTERGSMTFVSGAAGARKLLPNHTAIGATNGAIEAFARQLAREIAPKRVNVVAPGLVRTPAYDAVPEAAREAMYTGYAKNALVGRVGEPEDVAHTVLYLITNTYVTGAILEVDGGRP
jgi:NAD(P)-dependent dehydrogenase (short-subunit alcohol dehydrogenase family)